MTNDDQTILDLTRDNATLRSENSQLRRDILQAEIQMSSVGVPRYIEDGNAEDRLDFIERVAILCDMYRRAQSQ